MDAVDFTQSFVERCERSAPASELTAAFQDVVEQLGFRYFACCSHVNPSNPPRQTVVLHNYPDTWARSFAERRLYENDPVFLRAEVTTLPFFWDAPQFRAALTALHAQILREAAEVGLAHGYTVPIHLSWVADALRASCSVVPDSSRISMRAYRDVQVMATYLYASIGYRKVLQTARESALRNGPLLSVRERQCLELAAYGKSDWAISQILKISEHTVHKHVEAAKRRLGATTRTQAVVYAVQRREISLGDVVKATVTDKKVGSGRSRKPPVSAISEMHASRRRGLSS